MSDDILKRAVLDAALARAASEGFNAKVLEQSAAEAGATAALGRLFPDGVPSLLAYYSQSADAEMVDRLAQEKLTELPPRLRIRTAVLTRLAILAPHKEAARRAGLYLAFPVHAPLAATLVAGTVDAMWRAAGDVSTDFSWYSKRASLGAVYTATLMCWFADASPDRHETMAFLDARIENVMQYEKLKTRVRQAAKTGCDRLNDLVRR